jgi:hypothetical protein
MAIPRGLDHFGNFFKEFQASYVLVGGAGLSVLMDEEGLTFRKTTDLDIVLLTKETKDFNDKIADYIEAGGYQTKEATAETPRYYRFFDPTQVEFPVELEFFSNNVTQIELKSGQYIQPVNTTTSTKISSILLDDLYFGIIQKNIVAGATFSVLGPIGQICLKAKAFREIKARGEDHKKCVKHRNDIVRISQMLNGKVVFKLEGQAKDDFENVFAELSADVDEKSIQQITDNKNLKKEDVLSILKVTFDL